jgi:hypothetical protein
MRKPFFPSLTLAAFTAIGLSATAQSPAPNDLTASYSLTQTGFGSADRITSPGTIYIIRTDGILARAIADHITPTNTFKDGKLIPPSKGFLGAFGTAGDTKQVEPGNRFYLHSIEMKDGAAVFTLLSLDKITVVTQNGSTSTRLRMYLKFPVSTEINAAQLHALTDPAFSPEGTAAPAQTVSIGESSEDVLKTLGAPQQQIDLGAKKILVYKQLKITLVDGKVTDAS